MRVSLAVVVFLLMAAGASHAGSVRCTPNGETRTMTCETVPDPAPAPLAEVPAPDLSQESFDDLVGRIDQEFLEAGKANGSIPEQAIGCAGDVCICSDGQYRWYCKGGLDVR